MKKRFAGILLSLVFLLSLTASALAHAPRDIRMQWDRGDRTLRVYVNHGTGNVKRHYVKRIEVFVNWKRVATQTYGGQGDDDGLYARFRLGRLPEKAVITVKASCNREGSRKESITIYRGKKWNS